MILSDGRNNQEEATRSHIPLLASFISGYFRERMGFVTKVIANSWSMLFDRFTPRGGQNQSSTKFPNFIL